MLCIDFLKFLENQEKNQQNFKKNFNSDTCFFSLVKLGMSPVGIYLLKLTHSNTRASKIVTLIVTLEQVETRTMSMTSFCVFIVNFELISHLSLMFLFSTLNRLMLAVISPVAYLLRKKYFTLLS